MDEMMDVDVRPVAAAAGSMFARLSPELFEYILLQLDVLDLEVARGVCKAWRTTIKGMEARDKQCRYATRPRPCHQTHPNNVKVRVRQQRVPQL